MNGLNARSCTLAATILFFSACGGGSDHGGTNPGGNQPPPSQPPGEVAVAVTAGTATNGAGYRARILNLGVHDLQWDGTRNLLYASLSDNSEVRARQVVALDPALVRIVRSVRPEARATKLRLSLGGEYLYASQPETGTVVRYLPESLEADVTIKLGVTNQPGGSPLRANDIAPHPHAPRTLAIALADPELHPSMRGPVVFDDDIQRPVTAIGQGFAIWAVAWDAQGTGLFGFTEESFPRYMVRFNVDHEGITVRDGWNQVVVKSAPSMALVGDYLRINNGEVVRADDLHRAGEFVTPWPCLFAVPDEHATLVFALCGADDDDEVSTALTVHAFNAQTFQPVAKATIRNLRAFTTDYLRSFVRWGPNGLAFMTPGEQLVLIDGEFVTSMSPTLVQAPAVQVMADEGHSEFGATFRFREVAIDANDMAYDRTRDRIYLSAPGSANYGANAILSLDPSNGSFDSPRPIGSQPNTLAISGVDEYLYVGTDGSSSVARVRIGNWELGADLELSRSVTGPHHAKQIFPAPGAPRTVVIARSNPTGSEGTTTPANGIVVFDDSTQRARSGGDKDFQNGPLASVVQWGADAQTLYTGNTQTSANTYGRFLVDQEGPLFQAAYGAIAAWLFVYRDGKFYESSGRVLDAATGAQLQTAALGVTSRWAFEIDEALNTAYYVEQVRAGSTPEYRIHIYALDTMTRRDIIWLRPADRPDAGQIPVQLLRWGDAGLAILVSHTRPGHGHLMLVDGPAVLGSD